MKPVQSRDQFPAEVQANQMFRQVKESFNLRPRREHRGQMKRQKK